MDSVLVSSIQPKRQSILVSLDWFYFISMKPDLIKQLNDLKAEVASLEKDIAARQSDKAALTKAIADKDAQLTQCGKDKDALQQRIKGM